MHVTLHADDFTAINRRAMLGRTPFVVVTPNRYVSIHFNAASADNARAFAMAMLAGCDDIVKMEEHGVVEIASLAPDRVSGVCVICTERIATRLDADGDPCCDFCFAAINESAGWP